MYRLNASAGTLTSAVLHVGAGAFVIVGWPYLNPPAAEPVPPIPVELISEAELAERVEIPEQSRADEPPAEPEPQETVEPEEEPPVEETPPEPDRLPDPEPDPEPVVPPEPEETPVEEPAEEEPVREPDPKPEPVTPDPEPDDELDFASLEEGLVDLDPDKRDTPKEVADDGEGAEVDAERVGLGAELLASEEAMIRARVEGQCWNRQSGVPGLEELVVSVRFELDRQGQIVGTPKVENAGQIARSGNPFWRVAEQRAVAAVQDCAPYDYLSQDRYEVWRDITLNFRPPAG